MIPRLARPLLIATLALPLLGIAPPLPAPTAAETVAANFVWAQVEFLADDRLEGRDTGSRGHEIAARYVASQFRALGLEPGGTEGSWYQQVPLRRATTGPASPTIGLAIGGRATALSVGVDAAVRPSLTERHRSIDAPLVFVGYGVDEPLLGLDDYRGLDVRGKIVVALGGAPATLPSEVAAHLRAAKAGTAARHGAIGFVEVDGGERAGPDANVALAAQLPLVDWLDSAGRSGNAPAGLRVMLAFSPAWQERLFQGAARTLAAVRTQAAIGAKPRGFALAARLSLSADSRWQDFTSPEVIGLLPGSDPRLAGEHVVLIAHLDHLGIKPDAKPGEDAIYNGALDNAAGVATMLEAAREFVATGKRPRRSVLFIANTGEERGLLGADYFAVHPTVPAGSIVSVVDLDMPLPLYDFKDVVAFGADHSTVARVVADAGRSMGLAVAPDPMPRDALFVRSDHYRFVLRGVPAILLMTGYANGGEAVWHHFLANVYHTPADDLGQPIEWRVLARYGELNFRIARALADDPERPRWYAHDYFGDRFAAGQPRAERPSP